jgi:hypothetical protein
MLRKVHYFTTNPPGPMPREKHETEMSAPQEGGNTLEPLLTHILRWTAQVNGLSEVCGLEEARF